ncbi:MAG TPA: phosphoribosyltransferase family protein [Patescibacteria group bacterium]|nr:phosphoribosyltransferase family protein [Patescibacteria group bacterium]
MFESRMQAGIMLAEKLSRLVKDKNIVVLALARGGVVVGKVIAELLNAKLDVLVVRKIGAPFNQEFAIGAVAPKNTVYWNPEIIRGMRITKAQEIQLKKSKEKERKEKEKIFRGKKPFEISNKTVILVDDGVATGASVLAARKFLAKEKPKKVILAVPIIAKDTMESLKKQFDSIVSVKVKKTFQAVGEFYRSFPQVEDEEVIKLLK